MKRALAIALCGIIAMQSSFGWAVVNKPDCPIPEQSGAQRPEVTAGQVADVLCKAAEGGQLQPSAETVAGTCGVGIGDGEKAFAHGLKEFAGMIGSGAASAFGWAKDKISSLWSSEKDAAVGAEKAATANGEVAKSWLETVKGYYEASKLLIDEFMKSLAFNTKLTLGAAWCFPWKQKMELICQFITQVALEVGSMRMVTLAVDKTAAAAAAVAKFMQKTNAISSLKSTSFAERLKAAGAALEAQSEFKMVERFGETGNLKSRIDPITRQQTLHFEEIAVVDGKKVSVLRDVPRDAKTLAIDANFEMGKKLAKLTVEKSKGEHLLFADLNFLGKVNYFAAGTQAGDRYLASVGEAIRRNLKSTDVFFKNGGDELVVIVKSKNPNEVKGIIQRIHDALAKDRTIQDLFKAERVRIAEEIKAANRTAGGGVKRPTPEQLARLLEAARIRPSLSIGSAKIEGSWATDLARAEAQASKVKAAYKARIGLDNSKYANSLKGLEELPPTLMARPPVFDPVP